MKKFFFFSSNKKTLPASYPWVFKSFETQQSVIKKIGEKAKSQLFGNAKGHLYKHIKKTEREGNSKEKITGVTSRNYLTFLKKKWPKTEFRLKNS